MAIAIFPSLEGESLEDVSIKLAEKWRIGQKGLNNGIILVVFAQDRKLRFEVGYGLEPVVPDIVAGQIIREVIAPRFREGQYAAGLSAAIDAVYGRLEAGKTAQQQAPREKRRENQFPVVGFVVVGLIIVFILGSEVFRARRFTGGGGYTGGGGGWIPPIIFFPGGGGARGGRGRDDDGGGGGFTGGGGDFGGGGASGDW